jgi:electron transport complex protein RnfB
MSHVRTPAAAPVELINALDAWLPQTQCTRCGYPRCRAYAEALARGETGLNRCPPGGDVTIHALAHLLGQSPKPLDPACGVHEPRVRVLIDETACIGCRKCLDVCPVDAILGARKRMHTVLTAECTGCGLCLPPCPVDCIKLQPYAGFNVMNAAVAPLPPALSPLPGERELLRSDALANRWPEYSPEETARWRARSERRVTRLARRQHRRSARSVFPDRATIRADIRAALERARAKHRPRGST